MKKVKLSTLSLLLFSFVAIYGFFVYPVFAQELELEYPDLGSSVPPLPDFIQWFFRFGLAAAGALAFGVLVFGGIKYITSAGSGAGQNDAKEWIQGALLGLFLLLGSVLILRTINPDLAQLGVPPPPNFSFGEGSSRGPSPIILDTSVFQSCLSSPTIAAATCGCTVVTSSALLSSGIRCPSFPDPRDATGEIIKPYCRTQFDICIDRTNTGQRQILCCNLN